MKKLEFRSHNGDYCALTSEYVVFADKELKAARVFPLGCIQSLTANFGIKLVALNGEVFTFSFLYMHRKNKRKIKDLVKRLNQLKAAADTAEQYSMEIDQAKKDSIEKIRVPHLSRKKLIGSLIILAAIVALVIAVVSIISGLKETSSNDESFYPPGKEVTHNWDKLW